MSVFKSSLTTLAGNAANAIKVTKDLSNTYTVSVLSEESFYYLEFILTDACSVNGPAVVTIDSSTLPSGWVAQSGNGIDVDRSGPGRSSVHLQRN